jgi:LysM repeat protein
MSSWRCTLHRSAALAAALAVCLSACAAEPVQVPPTPSPALLRMPLATPTPSASATLAKRATPIIIASPTPSATPVTHVVAAGETLLSIAINHGVSLEALQAANPTIQARFLSVGAVLFIPVPEGQAAVNATQLAPPPPVQVFLSQPKCYRPPLGAMQCFVEARNPGTQAVEFVSVRMVLAGDDGLPFASPVAYSALEVLPPGGSAPLAVAISPPPAQAVSASAAELLTGNLALEPAPPERSVPLEVAGVDARYAGDGQVTLSGYLRAPATQALSRAWVVITLYDVAGAVVGFRRHALSSGLLPGETGSFSTTVGSLGGPIASYVIAAEGRP